MIMHPISIVTSNTKQNMRKVHIPAMAGRHDLVPREILLPLPSARTLLWQEARIPMSEKAERAQQRGGQESSLLMSASLKDAEST